MSTPAITVFTKRAVEDDPAGSLLSKRISLVNDQVVSDGAPCRMAIGDAKVISVATAAELVRVITSLGSDNALALGTMEEHVEGPCRHRSHAGENERAHDTRRAARYRAQPDIH